MTYRDSDASFLPARPPQHAAPISFLKRRGSGQPHSPGRLRRLTRRARQLLIMTLAWATGLGLVAGAITVAVMATGPTHAAPTQGAAPHYAEGTLQRPLPYAAASRAAARRTSSHSTRTQSGSKGGPSGHRPSAAFSGHAGRTTNVRGRLTSHDDCRSPGAAPRKRRPGKSCPPGWQHAGSNQP